MNKILNSFISSYGGFCRASQNGPLSLDSVFQTQVRFRARRATRIRKEKVKQANKLRKMALEAQLAKTATVAIDKNAKPKRPMFDDSHLRWPMDNVYQKSLWKEKPCSMQEIYEKFQMISHPTVYNVPDGLINAVVEINFGKVTKKKLQAKKFNNLICYPNTFPYGMDKKVVAFSKDLKMQEAAYEGGASKAGGVLLMKEFLEDRLFFKDFDFVVATPDVLLDLNTIRVQLDRKFPNTIKGTLGPNIKHLSRHFAKGIEFFSDSCPVNMGFGWVEVVVGRINQPLPHLEENVQHLIETVEAYKKDMVDGTFIRRVVLQCPPSTLQLRLAHWEYLEEYSDPRETSEQPNAAASSS